MTTEMTATAQDFGQHLQRILDERGLTQSEFAALVWGRKENQAGHSEAIGRDRISAYVRGASLPGPKYLSMMAKALDMPMEEFAPSLAGAAAGRSKSGWSIASPAGRPDLIHLTVDLLLPAELAPDILSILTKAKGAKVN